MNEINTLFFELIRVAIGTQLSLSRQPSPNEWTTLYEIAKKQSLIGICFAGVQRLCISETSDYSGMSEILYLTWMGMAAKIQQRNEVVNRQCVEVQQMIEKEDFCTYIMKGQGNSTLYRASYDNENENENLCLLRQSGDIDIYLEGGFEKVMRFVNETHPTNEVNELEIHYHCLPNTEVEIHYKPFIIRNPIKDKVLQKFFKEEGERCFNNKIALPNGVGCINVPTTTFNLVHQLVHIYHHLFTTGIGIRQLMDYYFVLCNLNPNLNLGDVKKTIHNLGLDRFASALMWVIAHVFANGNANENEKYPWATCEKDGELLLKEIIKSGNFGHMDETKADLSNKWKSFWYVNGKTFRFWRFDHWAWFWSPVWRIYHFAWRKANGFK